MLQLMRIPSQADQVQQLPKKGAAALAQVFDEYGPFLFRIIERKLGAGPHVEDVVQEVFIVTFKKWDEIESYAHLKTWLYRVAMNKCLHAKRSYARRGRLADAWDTHQTILNENQKDYEAQQKLESVENARRVRETIEKLSPNVKDIFVLYELESVSGKEISQMLEIPLNTVWSRLRKARDEFKMLWQNEPDPDKPTQSILSKGEAHA